MLNRLDRAWSLAIVAAAFLLFIAFNNLVLEGVRVDLTENGLYTLTDGTREILDEIDEPITLHFFFSEKVSADLTSLRTYAYRVRAMLDEYVRAAGGKLQLRVIDPEPFSENEDLASAFGLQGVPVNQGGDDIYFGLAGTNALDDQEIIGFFQPDREEYLEYELSKLVSTLNDTSKPRLAIYAEVPVFEQMDPRTFQQRPGWVVVQQLRDLFDLEEIDEISSDIEAYDLLFVIHPKSVTDEESLFALDQFVMKGGRLVVFSDPFAETDQGAGNPGMPAAPGTNASNLNALTKHWGVSMREDEVLGDAGAALTVSSPGGAPVRHLGIAGYGKANVAGEDIVMSSLENLNVATTGIIDVDEIPGIQVTPLIRSSEYAMPMQSFQFQFLMDPASLQAGFRPTGEIYPIAVRISGSAPSAFPDGLEGFDGDLVKKTDQLQVVLVADTDLLSDRLWVQVQSFFGQQIASAFADNGSFVTNLAENLSGSNALIEVRSRGQFTRPFTVVEQLRREAEARYLQSAEDLQAQLTETERQVSELHANQVEDSALTLTPEQEDALVRFREEQLRIRKELREVRHQLDKDIENLGAQLKFLNIVLMPLLLTALLLASRISGPLRKEKERAA